MILHVLKHPVTAAAIRQVVSVPHPWPVAFAGPV